MRIYLDVSCLNRPFDDQSQPRIRMESEAVMFILDGFDAGQWTQVASRMAEIEISEIADDIRRRRVLRLLPRDRMELTRAVFERAKHLVEQGVHAADAVHLAAAEALGADVMLTCDDRLLRHCSNMADRLDVDVNNPVDWLKEHYDAPNVG